MKKHYETIDEQIKKEYEFAMSHLDHSWIEMDSEYQNQNAQFPIGWTRNECYWFSRALSAVKQNAALERERMAG